MTDFSRTNARRRRHDQQYRLRVDTDPDYIIPGLAELRIPAELSAIATATGSPSASSPSSPPSASSDSSRDSSATTSDDEVTVDPHEVDPALYRRRTTGECVALEKKNVKLRAKLSAIEGRKTNRNLMRFFGGSGSRQRGAPIPVEITEQSVGGCAFEVGLDVPDVNAAVEAREAFTL